MPDRIMLAGKKISLNDKPVMVKGRVATPNGLADAVFEGGGVKGIGHVGALAFAESIGIRWVNVAGTSAGAIVASLVAAGYTAIEMKEIMDGLDLRQFRDESLVDRIPYIGKVVSLVAEKGIYEGKVFEDTMSKYLGARNVFTFRDLIIPEYANVPQYRYRLRVVATDISRGKMLVLPDAIAAYGEDPDELSVARAVRMSMSIPFFFEPVTAKFGADHEVCYIVDGGLLSNYPVHLFDEKGVPSWPTFGFNLREPKEARAIRTTIRGPISLGLAMVDTMSSAIDRQYIEEKKWDRTIAVRVPATVKATTFTLTTKMRTTLYEAGRTAARRFFEDWWDWERHLKARVERTTMESV